MKTIVITGAECSGKTTLAIDLANHFKTDYCIEEARPFLQKLNRKHTYSDVEELAKKQEEIQFKFFSPSNSFGISPNRE